MPLAIAAVAAGAPAWAQSWNLYNGYTQTATIPFVNGSMSSTTYGNLDVALGGTRVTFAMDTGSTGIVSSAYQPQPGDVAVGPGSIAYTSSGVVENGTYYLANIAIMSGGVAVATARVKVLQVTSITCLPGYSSCTPNPNPTGVAFFGVGFNRGASQDPPSGPDQNPFLNLTSLNGAPITSAYRPGYIVTNSGVTLGLTSANTQNFAFSNLTPNLVTPSEVWNSASVTVKTETVVNGVTHTTLGSGTILQDTGINYMILVPGSGSSVPTTPCGQSKCAMPGATVSVYMPWQNPLAQPAYYTFTVPTPTTTPPTDPAAPVRVEVDGGSATFVNTGREFYADFNYIYDAQGGFVGYQYVGPAGSGSFAAGLYLSGQVSFPNGFFSSFDPQILGGTTILQTGTGTISGVISGSGGLTISGGGSLFLSGLNTYAGGTTVTGGATVVVASDGNLGDPSGGLTLAGGGLTVTSPFTTARTVSLGPGGGVFDTNGNSIAVTTPISGVGGLVKQGLGLMTLAGLNSYTGGTSVMGGVLQLTPGASLSPLGSLFVNSGATFDLNNNSVTVSGLSGSGGNILLGSGTLTAGDNTNTVVASVLTGSGGFTKQGAGMMSLTAANTYTGPTSVLAGRLAIDGNITSSVTVGSSGNLGGSGAITGDVVNNGIVSPGNSIGTLTINGSYTGTASSSLQIEANAAGQSDLLKVVGGTATLGGGTVAAMPAPNQIYAMSNTYTILTATGGRTGTFANATSSLPFLQASLSYDFNNAYLTLTPGGFARGAQTPNAAAVGRVFDLSVATATGDFANVIGATSSLTAAQGTAVMNAISGQNYSGFANAAIQTSLLFMNNFSSQVGGSSQGATPGSNRVALAEACDYPTEEAPLMPTWGVWGGAVGGTGVIAGNANSSTLTYNVGGFAAGIDRKVAPNLLLGATLGYTSGQQWSGGFQGNAYSNSVQTGLYGSYNDGATYVDAIAGYSYTDNQMRRAISVPLLPLRMANGGNGANQFFGQIETGYRFEIGGAASAFVTPFARLQGSTVTQSGFTETGADSLNLTVASQTTQSLRTVFGAQLGGGIDAGWRDRLGLKFKLGWSHEYADTARPVTANLAGAPAVPFTVNGAAPQRDGVVIGLSADTAVAAATSLYLRYEGEIVGQDSAHALTAGLRMTW